jgi:hypothetical protein
MFGSDFRQGQVAATRRLAGLSAVRLLEAPQDRFEIGAGSAMRRDLGRTRRTILQSGVAVLCASSRVGAALGDSRKSLMTLLTAPIELTGNWGHMIPDAAAHVVERMRHACLEGIRLVSDDQPHRLRVDEHTSGPPAIWLHPDGTSIGWIIVDVGQKDWSKLAYQFGHELGHVTANSWRPDAKPATPCQWLEEAMVEAFSLRGLALLADNWSRNPPFQDDSGFGAALAVYRQNIVERYAKLAQEQGHPEDLGAWFKEHRPAVEAQALGPFAQAASLTILAEYERNPAGLEALGALNRWPGRSGIPLEDYFRAWEASCAELQASHSLPVRLRELLALG